MLLGERFAGKSRFRTDRIFSPAEGCSSGRLSALEWLDGEECLQWGILDAYTPQSNEVKVEEDFSDTEYELEKSNGLEPTVIFKILTPASSTKKLAPEQCITLFALRLAFIEKLASGIGTLSFVWATTIILGGFASSINPVDFMVITLILATEGTRLFSRSGEMEWQHLASKSSLSSVAPQIIETLKLGRAKTNVGTKDKSTVPSEPPAKLRSAIRPEYARSLTTSWHDDPGSPIGRCKEENFQPMFLCSQSMVEGTHDLPSKRKVHIETEEGLRGSLDEEAVDSLHYDHHASWDSNGVTRSMSRYLSNTTECSSGKLFPKPFLDAVDGTKSEGTELVPKFCCGYSSILSTRGVTAVLYWVQMISVIICLVLSCWRLSYQEYCPPDMVKAEAPVNLYVSLNIFYILALTEGSLFLLKRIYWDYKMYSDKMIMVQTVNGTTEFGIENQETIRQFFYEVYKKCIDGSVFDGLSMDIVDYSLMLLQSDNSCQQLGGLRMLRKVVDRYDGFSIDALRRIGTAPGLLERLVDMLSWRSTHQDAIRQEVAALIYKGIRYSKNCFRVAAVPGSMEGIVSLLRPHENYVGLGLNSLLDSTPTSEGSTALRLDGLRILLAYARDPVNLLKIGETLDLVPILVSFIVVMDVHEFKKMAGTKLETFDKALRLLAMLAMARNTSGTILRPVIVRQVSGIASLRDILEFGDAHPQLQWMAIEILINLTLEDDIRRAIGSTGGVIRNLLRLYTRNPNWSAVVYSTEEAKRAGKAVSAKAGDALNLLAIMNRENCTLMMDLQDSTGRRNFMSALIGLLHQNREQTVCAAKILRSLLECGNYSQKREIGGCIVRVMRLVMASSASQKMHEAVVGLLSRLLDVVDEPTFNMAFVTLDRRELVSILLGNLGYSAEVTSRYPRVRRHSFELIVTLVKRDPIFLEEFMKGGLLELSLLQTLDSICEAEDFVIFSGAEGLTRHTITMENLVRRALQELQALVQGRNMNPSTTSEHFSSQ